MVGLRTIRTTLPDAPLEALERLPGVASVERHGEAVVLRCTDSDDAIRALLDDYPEARDIEISSAALEDAFLELTAS
jgi:ABC-2 type transport system ATP-binding protein